MYTLLLDSSKCDAYSFFIKAKFDDKYDKHYHMICFNKNYFFKTKKNFQ